MSAPEGAICGSAEEVDSAGSDPDVSFLFRLPDGLPDVEGGGSGGPGWETSGGSGGPDDFNFLLPLGAMVPNRDLLGGKSGLGVSDSSFDDSVFCVLELAIDAGIGSDRGDGLDGADAAVSVVDEETVFERCPATASGTNTNSQTGHSTGWPRFLSGMASFPLQFGQRSCFIGFRASLLIHTKSEDQKVDRERSNNNNYCRRHHQYAWQ